jgi:hypothetical protein
LIVDPSEWEVKRRDELASNTALRDFELFNELNAMYAGAVTALGPEDATVCALGLEAGLFSGLDWSQFPPQLTTAEVQELLERRMASPSVRICLTVGRYLWNHGSAAQHRHGGVAAIAALEWGRQLLALSTGSDHHDLHDAVRALDVAAELGIAANQKQVITDLCVLLVDCVVQSVAADDPHPAAFAADLISRLRDRFTPDQRQRLQELLGQLDAAATKDISPASPPILAGRLLDLRRDLAFASDDPELAHRCEREHAALLAKHAADRGDANVEALFLDSAIKLAVSGEADPDTLNDYRQRRRGAVARGVAAMKTITARGQLPPEIAKALDQKLEQLAAQPVPEFLAAFAVLARPTTAGILAFNVQALVNTPMRARTPRHVITSPGETVAAGNSDESCLWETGLLMLGVAVRMELLPLWQRRQVSGDLTADTVIDAFRASGNFAEDNLEIIATGLEAVMRNDEVSALHILVPQLEDVLRALLRQNDHETSHQKPTDTAVTEEITLGSVLQGLETAGVITTDDCLLFNLVLDGPLGMNLRNRIGHGLVRKPDCSPEAVVAVLQCYAVVFSLSMSGAHVPEPAGQPTQPSEPS